MLIFPWLTAPFIGIKSFVRFLPVATFANLFIIVFTVIAHTVVDWFNIFPFGGTLKKAGIFKMKKMSPRMYWEMTTVLAVVLYGYQYIVEKVIRQTNDSQSRLQALKAHIQKRPSNS